jgi:hypothetical protein
VKDRASPPPWPRPPSVRGSISCGNQLLSASSIELRPLIGAAADGPKLRLSPRDSISGSPDRFPEPACGQVVDHRLQTLDFTFGRFIARIASAGRESGHVPAPEPDSNSGEGRESDDDGRGTDVPRYEGCAWARQFAAVLQLGVETIPLRTLGVELLLQPVQ